MVGLFARRAFTGFGPDYLAPERLVALHQVHGKRSAALKGKVRQECPKCPGVYGMVDGDGVLIYVGKAKCLRSRLLSYFRSRSRDPKAGR